MDILSINITSEMLLLIAQIDEFKGSWLLFGRLAPERLQVLKKVATIASIGSSTRIEGSQLSDAQVERLLSHIATGSFLSRDEQEVGGYSFVCEHVFSAYEGMPFTENVIKQLHAELLRYSDKDARHRGEYKKIHSDIQAFDAEGKSLGVVFETTTPFDTPFAMQELIYWTREVLETKSLHPLLVIAIFIVRFLAIHPFTDGNGRLSRCLTTLLLLQSGYEYVSYCSLESIIEKNKESYYLALNKTQQSLKKENPDFTPWILFFLRSLHKQTQLLKNKVGGERVLREDLAALSLEIIRLLKEHGKLSRADLVRLTQANTNTLKKHLHDLVKKALIAQHGKARATWYTIKDLR